MTSLKRLLWSVLALGCTLSVQAQKRTIEDPPVDFTNTGIHRIVRIEADAASTRVHMLNEFIPGWWTNFPPQTFLEDEATGERYFITAMEGGEIDQHITMPASGDSLMVLIFPPLPQAVKKVHFGELDETMIYGIALEKPRGRRPAAAPAIPAEVSAWLQAQLGEAEPARIKPFDAPDFFGHGTARVAGYIRGYDPRAGFNTGIIHMKNDLTREDIPVSFDIEPDGRFVADIPLVYPQQVELVFQNHRLPIYLEQGSVQGMVLDWEDFLLADRYRNRPYTFQKTEYLGSLAALNRELVAFKPQRIEDYQRMRQETAAMTPMEVVVWFRDLRDRNLAALEAARSTISDDACRLLRYAEYDHFGQQLGDYEMYYRDERRNDPKKPELPLEFYGWLKEMPLNDPGLLTTGEWVFLNRFEYMTPLSNARNSVYLVPSLFDYLQQEKGIVLTEEDMEYKTLIDSINSQYMKGQAPDSLSLEALRQKGEAFLARYPQEQEDYQEMVERITPKTAVEGTRREMLAMDSVYYRAWGLSPSLFYDITKVRRIGNQKELDASERLAVSRVYSDAVHHPFLKDEIWRLYEALLPVLQSIGGDGQLLPAGPAAEAFKAIVDRFQGNLVLVDFWATTCGPCIANIRSSKEQRKKLEAEGKLTYVFITEDRQSPQAAYDEFVQEQELTNTFRVTRDDWNRFMQLFRFSGIPHHVLVGKDGKILDDDFNPYFTESELQKYE